ncbi:hypothetical protein AB0953_19155 [Streptomyces sp. NPDC046866]|uniref:hypothetical protein n=1 Tax=Streptomyces sp. NPDC046866 TaxID=3154921 RepID=UPI003456CEF6
MVEVKAVRENRSGSTGVAPARRRRLAHGSAPPPPRPVRFRRCRSARRIPAALTALALLGAAGPFPYDLAAVRAHRPGMAWRGELADRPARLTPADPEVRAAAGVLVAPSGWCCWSWR